MTLTTLPELATSARLRLTARPQIHGIALDLAAATFIMAAYNATFWTRGLKIFDGQSLSLGLFGFVVWTLTLFTIVLIGAHWLRKPVIMALLVISAVAAYYQDTLGVMIDREMIQNAMNTTVNESKHLMTPAFVTNLVVWGLLPALAVLWVKVTPMRLRRVAWVWPLTVVLTFGLFAGVLFSNFKTFSAVIREHHELMGAYQPGATIGGATKYAKLMLKTRNVEVQPLGRDAHKGPLLAAAAKPVLTVIFAGETARAQNFGLNGHTPDTTPELRARNVINFPDVTACGTSTAVSLPCMFSVYPREEYSHAKHVSTENLTDVLHHAGIAVTWLDNNTGDQGIATRLSETRMTAEIDPAACASGECTDAVFMAPIRQVLDTMTEDTVLILHMIGSHGPAYHLRYPPEFERFTPACETAEFAKCTPQEIANAYDNTILFTDHILSQTIDLLAAQTRVIPAIVYASDHGESLGEDGLYLHAAPWFMAPEVQTKVPMVLWLSDAYKATFQLDAACLAAKAAQPTSHDMLFHSVLGLMDIQTETRDPALDLTADCRMQG